MQTKYSRCVLLFTHPCSSDITMYRIIRAIVIFMTIWFKDLTDGAYLLVEYSDEVGQDYINKLDRNNKREIRTFDKDGIVGVTIIANGSTTQVHGYLICSEYEWKNVTFPSCQHVLIGASFVLAPQLESIKVCLKGNPFSTPCQNHDNIRFVDTDDFGFIHPRYEPQYRVGDIAVLRLDEGLNNPVDNPTKWVYPTNYLKLDENPEKYYGFVSNIRGVTRWKEAMDEKNTSLMHPFKNKHPYPVLDVCKNVSEAPRYYKGDKLGPFRSMKVSEAYDWAAVTPRTTYIFAAVIMYDNRKNLFPDHGVLINMEDNTVMGIFAFENPSFWNSVKHQTFAGTIVIHPWSNNTNRPLLHIDHLYDRRINVHHFSIVSYYLPWIYHIVKTDTENLMLGDTDEEETITSSSSSTDSVTSETTTPIPEMPDIYYENAEAFNSIVYDINPCGKAVSHLSDFWSVATCCATLCTLYTLVVHAHIV